MSSGISVEEEVSTTFKEMKKGKKIPWLIMKIVGEQVIKLDKVGAEDSTFEEFRDTMIKATEDEKEGRYAVYDVKDEHGHGKLLFVHWVSDNKVRIKSKMLYASSKANCLMALEGQTKQIQISEESEFTWQSFVDTAHSK